MGCAPSRPLQGQSSVPDPVLPSSPALPPPPHPGRRPLPDIRRRDSADEEVTAPDSDPFFWTTEERVEDHYDLGELLGKGQFGAVYRATLRSDPSQQVAVKKIEKRKTKAVYIDGEVAVLRECRSCPHIVALHAVYESPLFVHLVLEVMEGGELFERLVALGSYSEADAREPVRCIASTLAFLHGKGIVHRDVKPENLLLTHPFALPPPSGPPPSSPAPAPSPHPRPRPRPRGGDEVKLADFGLAKILDPPGPGAKKTTTVCGTWAYSSPEMHDPARPGYGVEVDNFALGIILFIVLGGYHPFDPAGDGDKATILAALQEARVAFEAPSWVGVSEQAKDLIKGLLRKNPSERLTAAEALAHPWMRSAYLSQELLSPDLGAAVARYRKRMAAKMRASMIVTIASVHMLQSATGRRWSAPSITAAARAAAAVGDGHDLPVDAEDGRLGGDAAAPMTTTSTAHAAAAAAAAAVAAAWRGPPAKHSPAGSVAGSVAVASPQPPGGSVWGALADRGSPLPLLLRPSPRLTAGSGGGRRHSVDSLNAALFGGILRMGSQSSQALSLPPGSPLVVSPALSPDGRRPLHGAGCGGGDGSLGGSMPPLQLGLLLNHEIAQQLAERRKSQGRRVPGDGVGVGALPGQVEPG
jgi:serine/threonine protein kinase